MGMMRMRMRELKVFFCHRGYNARIVGRGLV